jgi:hypothetical protein
MSGIVIEGGRADRALTDQVEARLSAAGRSTSSAPLLTGTDGNGVQAQPAAPSVLVLMPGSWNSDERRSQRALLNAAAAGVRHILDVSFIGAPPRQVTALAAAAGVRTTSIRLALHEQAVLDMVGEDGVIRVPAADWPVAVVAQRDVGEAIAALAADPDRYEGQELTLVGPTAYGFADIADMLTAATGTWSAYYPQSPAEAYVSRRHAGMSAGRIAAELSMFDAIREGAMSRPDGDLAAVLGHEPTELWEALQAGFVSARRAVQAA